MNFIYAHTNCLSVELCSEFIRLFEASSNLHTVGTTSKGDNHTYKRSTDIIIQPDFLTKDEWKTPLIELFNNLNYHIEEYRKIYTVGACGVDSLSRWGFEFGFNIQRYLPGEGFLKEHCESSDLNTCQRVLAWMIYLNDVSDGGGTEFVFQKYLSKAESGKLLVWPAQWTHSHRGIVSDTETKYIITGWYRMY